MDESPAVRRNRRSAQVSPPLVGLSLLLISLVPVWSCSSRRYLDAVGAGGDRVISLEVYQESGDELVLDIEYVYDGDHGRNAFIGGITLQGGKSTGHWSYVPARLLEGHHIARVVVGMNQDAPAEYFSDEVEISFYLPRSSLFFRRVVNYGKAWRRGPLATGR